MASRWETFHATGGQRQAWEAGFGSYLQSGMTASHIRNTPVVHATGFGGRADLAFTKPGQGLGGAIVGGVKSGQSAFKESKSGTIKADAPEAPHWGQGFGGPSALRSRSQSFITAPPSVPFTMPMSTPPNRLRPPNPLQSPSPYI